MSTPDKDLPAHAPADATRQDSAQASAQASAPAPPEDAALTEAGRKLFAGEWQFISAAPTIPTLPAMRGIEIALAGRSNVGKSSLVNALTGRKALARTSVTPGRTQELIFFGVGPDLTLVDMPGYGFAKAPKEKVDAWTATVRAYLRGRANLARVFVLIDARHGLKPVDIEILDGLDKAAVSYAIVLTKADQLRGGELEQRIAETQAGLARRPAAFPTVFPTSSREGSGIAELRAAVVRLMAERGMGPAA
ncbi:ribosome biogenesis GTP-binding protein YihA/YsxC [Ancylobacter amanitiformis]|uniref:Probable GTP-binding protein EngB n=1 Tax=Ancylobacter amanitiformis TaxID=217069 RepID=A0ABU0LVS0_9HYPH|nr:ribosome biogenesis GTP-binding protein YihA/YsxC [Ancylobacter amanitiformis]MDQ0512698.1 GTP-binding protein [Ancylobacter amanitiformis]